MGRVVFELPNSPDEFGVALAPADLRTLDFSALDYATLNRAGVEYVRTYFPNDFNDFFANNGIIMMLELVSFVGNVLSERADILVDESFLPTAQTKQAVIEHLALIDQEIQRATPATADIEISIPSPAPTEVRINAALRFTLSGPDAQPVFYELFRAPGDFTSPIVIPPGKRGIVGYGIEGQTNTPISVTSPGGANQTVDVPLVNVLDSPITVIIQTGAEQRQWRRVTIIEKAEPNDEVFEVLHLSDRSRIVFGDNTAGKAPLSGQIIIINFRTGGGVRGRIQANTINETRLIAPQPPVNAAVEVLFRNPLPSQGGTDEEEISQAKQRAPREFATHGNAVTGEDYGLLAANYSHPVFGSVSKALAVIRTGVDQNLEAVAIAVRSAPTVDQAVDIMETNFINRNIVELYVLAEGPNKVPATPNLGLKQGLIAFFTEINVLTDEVRVFDGAIKAVNVTATIVMSRNADPGTVKANVEATIRDFFNLRNFDMGAGMFLSNLYNAIQSVPGVKFVNIFSPADDILPTNQIADPHVQGIGFNEVITLGQLDLRFYFEAGGFKNKA